ncbi:MAG: peptide ABC transporter substrate-binding protein [Anaerolineae bacterium]|nr:peptide ABC transporter substrate-binding protein [Anaerolineae bacterium]
MKKLTLVGIIVAAMALILAACSAPAAAPQVVRETVVVPQTVVAAQTVVAQQTVVVPATPEPTAAEKVLRINLGSYPDIVDPQKSSFVNEIAHLNLIYEGLTKFNEKLETVPGAAESWEYNDDATQLTFKIRPGLKYSDGTPLNAARFRYSLMRNINPETAGEYAFITDEIAGAPEWRGVAAEATDEEKAALREVVSQSVLALDASGQPCLEGAEGYAQEDCLTLQLTLSKPAPYFHTVLGIWVGYPAKEENITEGGEIWWTSPKYQIGNGPFILNNMEPFVRARFEPNPNYEGEKAKVPIEYAYITDSAVAFQAYKNNEFDIIGLAAEDLATVKADAELNKEALIYPGSCTFAVMFHNLKEPFTDAKVREAFTKSLDRDAWVQDVLKGLGSPTLTWIPPGYPGYQEGETRGAFDPEAAKAALAASTYGTAAALPEVVDTFSDTPRNRTRNEFLVNQWKTNLGVDVKLNPVESTTYTALTKDVETSPQMFILGWCADYPDPQNWLSVYWKTGAFGERIGYSNPDFDALVNEADTTSDPAKRAELYAKAQDLLIESAPVAFMWNNVNSYLVKPWVTGLVTTPQDSGWAGIQVPTSIDIDASKLPQ